MMESRSAWIICQYAGSPRHGMNYRPYNLGRSLAAQGWDVTVFSGSWSHQFFSPPRTTGRYTIEDVDGLRYCWLKTPPYPESQSLGRVLTWSRFVRYLWPLARLADKLGLPKPDAIIVSSPSPYPILAGARLARIFHAKLVFEVRDLWPLSLIELGHHSPGHPFIQLTQWVEDFAYRKADRVVSVLPMAEPYMKSRGLREGKFCYIPNGISDDNDEGDPSSLPVRGPLREAFPGREFLVGYVGTLGLANALSSFLDAANLLKTRFDIGFAIVGEGSELDSLRARAISLGLDNLAFFPPVTKTEVPAILVQLDACYLGLKAEPLFRYGISPTKLFDYLLAARPVVMAIEAGNDIVSEAGCGYTVPPEDPAVIAKTIAALADLPAETRRTMGRAGRAYVLSRHRWEVLGKCYAEVLGC